MTVAAELEPLPGKPYDVRNGHHWRANDDGSVSYAITYRREEAAPAVVYYFTGATAEDALKRYEQWLGQRNKTVVRQAERRAKWGPLGTGKMAH